MIEISKMLLQTNFPIFIITDAEFNIRLDFWDFHKKSMIKVHQFV